MKGKKIQKWIGLNVLRILRPPGGLSSGNVARTKACETLEDSEGREGREGLGLGLGGEGHGLMD